jgi:hypothetical protein
MTTEEYISEMSAKLGDLKAGKVLAVAANSTNTMVAKRIFIDGLNAEGNSIGSYNTTDELYVNPNNSPKKFATKGKNGEAKFQNGNSHKTGYFKSYSEYRQKVGRKVDKVNLNLFGILQSDFSKALTQVSNFLFVAKVNEANSKKIEGNEGRFGKIFSFTNGEKERFKDVMKFESIQALK